MSIKLTGTVAGWKQHRCASCGALYRYRFSREAAVVARTPERREAKLRALLDRLQALVLEWRACPQCGSYQPDMVAQRRRFWAGWTCFAVWMGVFWLTAISVSGQGTIPTLTVAAVGYWLACAGVLAWTAGRDFNADPARNRAKSAAFAAAGTLRLDEPGTAQPSIPPPVGTRTRRARAIFAALLAVAVGLPILAEGTRRTAGWPLNPAFFPPVVGPGDQTTFYLPGTIRCVHGYWHGQAQALLYNAGRFGLANDHLPATTNDFYWAKELSVNPAQPDSDMHPWVTFTVPGNAPLAGQTVQVWLQVHTVFPRLVSADGLGDATFVTAERDLTAKASLVLAAPAAGRTYQSLWYGALAGSGVLLTLAMRRLWKSSRHEGQSTQTQIE